MCYTTLWLCGLAGSGKTTCLKFLRKDLPYYEFLNDSVEVVNFVKTDKESKHHYKPTPKTFVITDNEPFKYAVTQLVKKIGIADSPKIIEISRGVDSRGVIDLSYQYLFSQLTETVRCKSLFVYIFAPYPERFKRNHKRRPSLDKTMTPFTSFRCPDLAMSRFFRQDDFISQASQVDHVFVRNVYSSSLMRQKVMKILGGIKNN
jgi:hypothetical protein